ncbi:MAG: hypothetical protein JW768_13810 [Chitinispirillaceae bacterium]|nr:hypothetical protein [Chitinispirillaceae bacterium]
MNHAFDRLDANSGVRCFVLCGNDSVSFERARAAIATHLEKTCGHLNHEHVDPAMETIEGYIQRMLSPTLFGDARLFYFRHVQEYSTDELQALDAALNTGIPDAYAIIELEGTKKETAPALKKLAVEKRSAASPPLCRYGEFMRPPDWGIPQWIVDNTPHLIGRQISLADAEYLADRVGYDLDQLHSELCKIDLFLPDKTRIGRKTIDFICVAGREKSSFELAAALGRRDLAAALTIADTLSSGTVYLPLVSAAVGRHFWALFRIRAFLYAHPEVGRTFKASSGYKNPQQTAAGLAIGKAAGLLRDGDEKRVFPVIIKSGIVDQASSFTIEELKGIISWLLQFDQGIKTGRIEPGKASLQMLCYYCSQVPEPMREGAVS